MYTKETHTCHFTTVKWYTRYTQGKSMADGCLHQCTLTHTHTHTHSHTLKHCFMHARLCVHTHTHTHTRTLRHFSGRGRALSGSNIRNPRMWRMHLLIAENPSSCPNTFHSASPSFAPSHHFPLSKLRPLSKQCGHHTQARPYRREILMSSSN